MPRATAADLIYVSKGTKDRMDTLANGVSITERTGYSIEKLRAKAIDDRLKLARSILKDAEQAIQMKEPSFRTVTSRAYYAMYHSFRALSYFSFRGDDKQEHSDLPGSIPRDFPGRSRWENKLKQARLERNRADYDPYPKNDKHFETIARDLVQCAQDLVPLVRQYLRGKGWKP